MSVIKADESLEQEQKKLYREPSRFYSGFEKHF